MKEKVDHTKDAAINKARLATNIPLEFKTGQIIGNLSRVSGRASGMDDRGLAAVGDLRYGDRVSGESNSVSRPSILLADSHRLTPGSQQYLTPNSLALFKLFQVWHLKCAKHCSQFFTNVN